MSRPPITRANPYTPKTGRLAGQTFDSERQYRNALARFKGFTSWDSERAAPKPASRGVVGSFRPAEREAARRALDAVSRMRSEQLTIGKAAAQSGTTVAAVKKYAAPALRKGPDGTWRATPYDRLARRMEFLTARGRITLEVRDSRSASKIAAHWAAVDRYLRTGDERALRRFRGTGVTVDKRFWPFLTDPTLLDRLANAGMVSFEDLYAEAA